MTLSVDIANQAIQLIGDNQSPIAGSGNYPNPIFDSSPAGLAAAALYVPCVDTVGRQYGWDFSRNAVVLTQSGSGPHWLPIQYNYPSMGIQIWQIYSNAVPLDPNNPLPVRWTVANNSGVKVIWTNFLNATAVFSNQVNENVWDPGFREAVMRLLSSEFEKALAGRPDSAERDLESFRAFAAAGEMRTDT